MPEVKYSNNKAKAINFKRTKKKDHLNLRKGIAANILCIRVFLYVRSLILLCNLCHYMRRIVILSLCMCNGTFTIIQLCMFTAMLGIVNMASTICMLAMSVMNANIVMLCHTFFVVLHMQLNL